MVVILGTKTFAVLLCNFTDSPTPEPFTVEEASNGWSTNEKFWQATSYGKVSVADPFISDWLTLPITNSAFQSKSRSDMIQYAKDHSGIDQSKYVGFIVIFCEPVGTAWTSGSGAIFEPTIVSSTLVCHEMTHIFGEPTHSFDFSGRTDDAAPGEYFDQTDIMSAGNCWQTPKDPADIFSGAGPLHCMIWKDQFGWLEPWQVRRFSESELQNPLNELVQLQGRGRLSGNGPVAVFFSDISIEFATTQGFDAGLHSNGVLIHQSIGGAPWVIVPDLANSPDQKFWLSGDVWSRPNDADTSTNVYIAIQSIDVETSTALINVSIGNVAPLQDLQVLAIRMGTRSGVHVSWEYIEAVGISDGAGGLSPIATSDVISYIEAQRNRFFVVGTDGSRAEVTVGTLYKDGWPEEYITTVPDGSKADNLLSLPTF